MGFEREAEGVARGHFPAGRLKSDDVRVHSSSYFASSRSQSQQINDPGLNALRRKHLGQSGC
jgi:hypothetical protein